MDQAAQQNPPPEQETKKRLTKAGSAILEEYFQQHDGKTPAGQDLQDLVDRVQSCEQCEHYDSTKVRIWFTNRRKQRKRVQVAASQRSQPAGPPKVRKAVPVDQRFPSLNEAAMHNLNVMIGAAATPTTEVIKVWATVVGGTFQDVAAYVDVFQQNQHQQNIERLLTPAHTISPEPSSTSSPTVASYSIKQDPSPILSKSVIPPSAPPVVASSSSSQPRLSIDAKFGYRHQVVDEPKFSARPSGRSPQMNAILRGVSEALSTPSVPTGPPPRTAAEFDAMFTIFENDLHGLAQTFG